MILEKTKHLIISFRSFLQLQIYKGRLREKSTLQHTYMGVLFSKYCIFQKKKLKNTREDLHENLLG